MKPTEYKKGISEHCSECGILTFHYHIGFLDGAKFFTCRKHCGFKQCSDEEIRKKQLHGDLE